jgi:glycosyltransferase involved in cell wall biosynthesis
LSKDQPTLSVALIAKNEEAVLERCLKSVEGADEIVVVDTGSEDKTLQIAERYADTLLHFQWCNDFSKARNFAKQNCTSDWVLSIDADHINETPVEEIKEEIRKIDSEHEVAFVNAGDHHKMAILFKNDPNIEWVGAVHEVLNKVATVETNVRQTILKNPKPGDEDRNLRILLENEKTPRAKFYLGREYYEREKYLEAIYWMEQYLEAAHWIPEKAEAWLVIAQSQWLSFRGDKAREACLQAIAVNPDFTEALLFMSDITFEPWSGKWKRLAEASTGEDVLFNRIPKEQVDE